MEMKQSICDKDCFHCRFSDCVNHYGPYTEAKDIKKALNGQKKSRPMTERQLSLHEIESSIMSIK